jgi:hypothetical protein
MPLLRVFRVSAGFALVMAATGGYGQSSLANQTIKWDDYVFKFQSTGQMAQVFDNNGKIVGSILAMNGDLQVIPLPGTDEDKLKKSFADWKAFNARSHSAGGSSAAPSAGVDGSSAPCSTAFGASYFDGTAWKTMMLAVQMPKEKSMSISSGFKDLAKNPLNPRAGETLIYHYKDPAAPLTVGSSPSFCIGIPASFNPSQIMIGAVDIKKDHREIEESVSSRDSWLPPKRVQPVDVKRVSDTVVVITPKTPLPPGQYVLGGPPMVGIYDFGVQAAQ